MTMYAGGPGGDPNGLLAMAPPQSAGGLLQAPQTAWSQYPLTSGLLSSMAKNMGGTPGGSNSQMAYQMAGRPQMGPFAAVPVPAAIPGSLDTGGGSSSAGGGLAAGLLGSVAKNPGIVKQIGGLLGGSAPSLGAFGSGAAANGALAAAGIGSSAGIAGATAADSASIAAANSAWLAAQPAAAGAGAAAAGGGAAAAGADAGATGAAGSTGAGSALGAVAPWAAGALALAAPFYGMSTAPTQLGYKYFETLKSGLTQPPDSKEYRDSSMQLAALMTTDPKQVPSQIWQLAQQMGIQPLGQSLVVKNLPANNQADLQNTFGKYAKQN